MKNEALTLDEYQRLAGRTARHGRGGLYLAILALGVAGEAGEVADMIKKVVGHGHALDDDDLVKELGDVLWYLAAMSTALGVSLSDVADRNVAKLRARYPDGFTEEASRNRAEAPPQPRDPYEANPGARPMPHPGSPKS